MPPVGTQVFQSRSALTSSLSPGGRGHQPRADGTPSPCPQPGDSSQSTQLQQFLSRWRLIRPQHWVRRASRSGWPSFHSTLMLAMNINSRKRQELTRPPADSHLTSSSVTGSPVCPQESGYRVGLTPDHSHNPLAGSAGTQHSHMPSQGHRWHPVLPVREWQWSVSGYCMVAVREGYSPPAQP